MSDSARTHLDEDGARSEPQIGLASTDTETDGPDSTACEIRLRSGGWRYHLIGTLPEHYVVFPRRAMGMPTSQLMTLVGYGSAVDPFLDWEEAWTWVRDALDHASDTVVDPAERALAARVLDAVRDALRDTAAVDQAAEAYEGNAERDDTDSAAAFAIVTSDGDAERLDGQGEP